MKKSGAQKETLSRSTSLKQGTKRPTNDQNKRFRKLVWFVLEISLISICKTVGPKIRDNAPSPTDVYMYAPLNVYGPNVTGTHSSILAMEIPVISTSTSIAFVIDDYKRQVPGSRIRC